MNLRRLWFIPATALLAGLLFCINRPIQIGSYACAVTILKAQPGAADEGNNFEFSTFANSNQDANLSGMSVTLLNTYCGVYFLRHRS